MNEVRGDLYGNSRPDECLHVKGIQGQVYLQRNLYICLEKRFFKLNSVCNSYKT